MSLIFFFFTHTRTTEIYTLPYTTLFRSSSRSRWATSAPTSPASAWPRPTRSRSEEHTSELQSLTNLVCRLLLEKKKRGEHPRTARRIRRRPRPGRRLARDG